MADEDDITNVQNKGLRCRRAQVIFDLSIECPECKMRMISNGTDTVECDNNKCADQSVKYSYPVMLIKLHPEGLIDG